ncbi:hypothetical protein V2J09_006416 [Rumex salicifolius]
MSRHFCTPWFQDNLWTFLESIKSFCIPITKCTPSLTNLNHNITSNLLDHYNLKSYTHKSKRISDMTIIEQSMDVEQAGNGVYDDDGRVKRTGTLLTASAHIITAVIGSGVLSLAWATAQLGWVVGPPILLTFSCITYITSMMLADCYRAPHPVTDKRNYTYSQAVESYLGGVNICLCRLAQYTNCAGVAVGYTITASISMVAIIRANCYHKYGHEATCDTSHYPFMIGFGIIQVVLSQLPNFHKLSWLSIVAAVMSFSYASIGLALSLARVISNGGAFNTSLTGTQIGLDVTSAEKVWKAFQAVGNMAFSYTSSVVLIEIQDTLKSSPPENKVMKKAASISIATTTIFYLLCGCIGYAAFGNDSPGDLLTDFGFYNPYWLVDFANMCIAVHLVGAYQVYVQPLFGYIESSCKELWPESIFINRDYPINIHSSSYSFNCFRLVYRTIFVIISVILAMIFPFFNSVLGLLGAAAFFPLTVYFPIQMHIVQKKINVWSIKWIMLNLLILVCLVVSLAAGFGSIQGLVKSVKDYKPFGG